MLMHANVTTRWPESPTKRQRQQAKKDGEPEPESRPDPRDVEAGGTSELKRVVQAREYVIERQEQELKAKDKRIEELIVQTGPGVSASPAAVELAATHGVALSEISGSGLNGAITVADVRRAVAAT